MGSLAILSEMLNPPTALAVKRKVFISYFHADRSEVDQFIYDWSTREKVFIPKALATFNNEDFIDSDNTEYVMGEIRRRYIGDASVTIVLIGKCCHSRKYVDWEIKASLRRGEGLPNGLLAYVLPSAMPSWYGLYGQLLNWNQRAWPHLPERLAANWQYYSQDLSYARYYTFPTSAELLRQQIELAVWDRANRAYLIKNSSDMMRRNAECRVCGMAH